ncbi:Transcription factor HHO2 [Mucuna pruriens]|uniref:Transcription factor HHO2 n=1 Tax=Mucuna pruriens TaxID=157652 RepID=A0A371FC33_MUCPR|nr:Transcription factor HHO2 [Mucuna pruriens]
MQFAEKMQPRKMGFREYIEALEEERRKIQVFPKELPLSLELVTQAIEACRQQLSGTVAEYNLNGQSECSEQTSTDEGPVFEEFIPIKKRASQDFVEEEEEDEDDDEHHSHKHKNRNTTDRKKSDWLRSVQLWNHNPPPAKEDVPRKTNVVEVKRNGGAFQPFHREEKSSDAKTNVSAIGKAPSSPPVAATSSTGPVRVDNNKREEKGQAQRKQRRCWSQELHKRFLHALQQLGGADCEYLTATPKQIREHMKVDGLTNDEVKSHLQKFRLHTRRSPMIHSNGSSQTASLFLVGNIFVQPAEYGAVATSTASGGELTTVTPPTGGIYAPVASHPPAVTHTPITKPHFNQLNVSHHSHSEERPHSVHSNSPASSSSTHTITTSPPAPSFQHAVN